MLPAMDEAAYDVLVGRIYDLASDPAAVTPMLLALGAGFAAHACTLGVQDLVSHALERSSVGTPEEMDRDCLAYYRFRNPFLAVAARRPTGSVFSPEELVPPETVRGHEYVHDYLDRYDVPQVLAMKLWQGRRVVATLNVMRGRRQPAFGAAERRLASRLVPHLQRATGLAQRLGWERSLAAGLASRLGALGSVTVLLDAEGRVPEVDAGVAALLQRAGGLRLDAAGLHAADPRQDAQLAALVALATRGDAQGRRRGGSLAVRREAGRPLAVLVAPLRSPAALALHGGPVAVLTVTDPDGGSVPAAEQLERLYGLTGSEAAVALQLAGGRTLAEAAERLELTVGSARQYLQRVFGKMQVGRQAELVRLVTRLAGGLPPA